jgi:hypothetical protein
MRIDDYYRIYISQGQTIKVTLSDFPPDADYDIILYDIDALTFLAWSNAYDRVEQFEYTKEIGGRELYYLRVHAKNQDVSDIIEDTYRLKIELDPLIPPDQNAVQEDTAPAPAADIGNTDPPLPPTPEPAP